MALGALGAPGTSRAAAPSDDEAETPSPSLLRPVAAVDPALRAPAPPTTLRATRPLREIEAGVHWDRGWTRFSTGDTIATGVGVGMAAAGLLMGPNRDEAWRGGVLIDGRTRGALRLGSEGARSAARSTSDAFLGLSVAYPFVVDSLFVAGVHHGNADVAAQMALINAEVLSITVGIQTLTKALASRERPYGGDCGSIVGADTAACTGADRYQSFFSGHTAIAFASAAVTCSHHMNLPLYGQDSAVGPCVGGFALATATGALRILGDRHYLSDVLIGAAVGSLVGFGVPLLFHYGPRAGDDDVFDGAPLDAPDALSLQLVPAGAGAAVVGSFR